MRPQQVSGRSLINVGIREKPTKLQVFLGFVTPRDLSSAAIGHSTGFLRRSYALAADKIGLRRDQGLMFAATLDD
jgi:hypothetical protein